ncbi:glucose-6-phosphate dehydrogenase [Plastoroseomonas hellenica]|nr:glucose-6-phosphate dehydrogenase [Plastoroseomonas hellenica]
MSMTSRPDHSTGITSDSDAAPAPPCTFVIFGGTGDLTRRLLMPALYNLARAGLLDPDFRVIGVGRSAMSDAAWRDGLDRDIRSFAADPSAEFHAERIDERSWGWLQDRLHYLQGDIGTPEFFAALADRLTGNVVFYLAIPASAFGPAIDRLGDAGLLREAPGVFRRVVIEKPFGEDLASACALNRRILAVAPERQFFRIDHFLGKESVQAIMALRFANVMFEAALHRDYVDHVEITAAETIGVEQRGSFYEPTGALRDMVPNHLFQLLCMVAMEPPESAAAEAARDERMRLLRSIRPVTPQNAARGQYAAGAVAGLPVPGYRQEVEVAPDSRTETYAALVLDIDNRRWAGVPFFLRTGKRLGARRTEIAVHFRRPPADPFSSLAFAGTAPNTLRFQIDPEHRLALGFSARAPGAAMRLQAAEAAYQAPDAEAEGSDVGYEALLYGCMRGDATLFQRGDIIEASWAVVDPLLRAWSEGTPERYAAGSDGPASADALFARSGRGRRAVGQA